MLDQLPEFLRPDGKVALARALKAARRGRGLTLAALSEAVGLDKGYLSRVERGLKAPSVATVLNLARVLDVPVAQLFGEAVDEAAIHVSRARERGVPADAADGYRIAALTSGKGAAGLEGFLMDPPAAFSEEMRAEHDGQELLFVVSGAVDILFADRTVSLAEGDALQFPGRLSHQVRRTAAGTRILIAVSRS